MGKAGLGTATLLILAASVVVSCGTAEPSARPLPERVYAQSPEANFALYLSYGGCLPESLDTFQGTFSRSMCPPAPPVTLSLTLSTQEMEAIYRGLAAIDLFSYPEQFSVAAPEGAVVGRITPSNSYYLRVRNGATEKELYWTDDITEPGSEEADRLRVFLRMIIDLIYQHRELQQVPTPGCGCA